MLYKQDILWIYNIPKYVYYAYICIYTVYHKSEYTPHISADI